MISANENCQRKCGKEERIGKHLALVMVWVPKDKVVEIRSMAIGLLRESLEDKNNRSDASWIWLTWFLSQLRVYFKRLRLISRGKA